MADAATLILTALDRHLHAPSELRLLGGAALILGYGLARATEDVDLLLDDDEFAFLADHRDLGPALEETNAELEPLGLYISNIWGPEQQILTPRWRENCRAAAVPALKHLRVSVLGPLDLIVSKLARADEIDLADMRHLIVSERLSAEVVRRAMREARVPEILREAHQRSVPRLEALLDELGGR